MGREIERKFLVSGTAWRQAAHGRRIRQGYLSLEPGRTVRIRLAGEDAWLTIKGRTAGLERAEFEYPIPVADARVLLEALCIQPVIDKTRYTLRHGTHDWEIDEFHGENAGLVVAEIELGSTDEVFERPSWLGREVSDDARYFNASLVRQPFKTWPQRARAADPAGSGR